MIGWVLLWSGMNWMALEVTQSKGFMMTDDEKFHPILTSSNQKMIKKCNNRHIPGDKNAINNQQNQLKQGNNKFGWREWYFFPLLLFFSQEYF